MKLDELHVDQFRAGVIRERVAVASAIPTIARDLVSLADSTGGQNNGLGAENFETPAFAIITECSGNPSAIGDKGKDANLHVHVDALMHAVVLQRANHFETSAVADVREPWIFVTAKIALKDAAIFRAIEHRAPGFEFAHASGRLLRMQLGHAPLVHVLTAAHGVGEMHFPIVAIIDIRERGRDPAFGHDGVRLCRGDICKPCRPETPAADASMAARNPAPPEPMTRTSCSKVS